MELKIQRLYIDSILPKFAHSGDAGMDLYAHHIISESDTQITYGSGIAVKLPENHVGLIFPRSSIRNYDLTLANSVGVLDCTYTGEIQVTFNKKLPSNNVSVKMYEIGERCCQLIVLSLARFDIKETDTLSNIATTRGDGGFGSTGTH